MAQRFPNDFQGAAPEGIDIICLSSDEEEEICDLSMTSVLDLQLSSEDEEIDDEIMMMAQCVEMELSSLSSEDEEIDDEIMMMAQCVEMELSSPILVPGPSSTLITRNEAPQYNLPRYGTFGTSSAIRPTLDQSFFSLGRGNGPIRRDDRVRNNHPIKLCREIIPIADTPMSPPPEDKGPIYDSISADRQGDITQQSLDTVTNHFQGMGIETHNPMANYSDCVICGKSTVQIQNEAVMDYLHKTATLGESANQLEARKRAFIEGMQVGTFLLLPGGVSQAAACDGNVYTIDHTRPIALPGTLPL